MPESERRTNHNRRNYMLKTKATLAAAPTALVCLASLASAADVQRGVERSPVGVWRMHVTFTDCDTGAAIRAPFPALNTFYADGNISETAAGLAPAFRSTSHGRWAWTGKNTLAIKSEIQLFDSNFLYWASQVFDRRLRMSDDGGTMTGRTTYVRYDVDGVELFRGCWTEDGSRAE
jgi:hypothetical protein